MANALRVLVVDDSVVFRKVVSGVIAADRSLQLVGTAANGKICLQKIEQTRPDVITLDLEMPEMDGFAVLTELQKKHPHIRVVVFSMYTERGAAQTFNAMRLGASDFLSKGLCLGGQESSLQYIKDQLLPKIKQFAKLESVVRTTAGAGSVRVLNGIPQPRPSQLSALAVDAPRVRNPLPQPRPSLLAPPPDSRGVNRLPPARPSTAMNTDSARPSVLVRPNDSTRPSVRPKVTAEPMRPYNRNLPREIIAVGVSTGGPNALAQFLPMLPKSLPVPVVIVQHMPPLFTRLLAERLNAACDISVKEAADGMRIEAGTAYIAPGDRHLVLKRIGGNVIATLTQGAPENSCRPAVDVLFRSVAELYGAAGLVVMLTGMGKDGFEGTIKLKRQGAYVIAQDKATSVVWGMPGFVVEAGLANVVAPIDHVATEVERCLLQSTVHRA